VARLFRDLLTSVVVFVAASLVVYAIRGTMNLAMQATALGLVILFWIIRWFWQRRREQRTGVPHP
jgi:Flp pilus assembly protein TadB